jgi:plastocyanin
MFVVNGDTHVTHLEAPDGSIVDEITMNRGREYTLNFKADQTGYYTLHCNNHGPTMNAKILVTQ